MDQIKSPVVLLDHHDWILLYRPIFIKDEEDASVEYFREIEFDDIATQNRLTRYHRLWTEYDDGTIENGRHFVNRLRYLETRFSYPTDVIILAAERYTVDFCDEDGSSFLDSPWQNLTLNEVREYARNAANERGSTVYVVFPYPTDQEDFSVEPDDESDNA